MSKTSLERVIFNLFQEIFLKNIFKKFIPNIFSMKMKTKNMKSTH